MKIKNLKPTKAKLPENESILGSDASADQSKRLKETIKDVKKFYKNGK